MNLFTLTFMLLNYFILSMLILFNSMNLLTLNILLLLYNFSIIIFMNFWMNLFWFSYITFLVMIGGLMIIFMYFSSSNSNPFSMNMKQLNFFFIFWISVFSFPPIMYFYINSPSMNLVSFPYSFMCFKFVNFNKLMIYSPMNLKFTFFSMIYLLIALILIILMIMKLNKPSRSYIYV